MSESKSGSKRSSRRTDDAPELTAAAIGRGQWAVGGEPVSPAAGAKAFQEAIKRGRPRSAVTRKMLSLRVDPDVLMALRASGRGWQTRVNALLREAVTKGKL
jgi:uncharacterized protein (DUF4415 family)